MYIVPIHNGVSIATSKVQMPKTGQHNTKQWVMVLMYFGLPKFLPHRPHLDRTFVERWVRKVLALIMQESYNIARSMRSWNSSWACCSLVQHSVVLCEMQFHYMLQHPMLPSSMQHIDIIRSWSRNGCDQIYWRAYMSDLIAVEGLHIKHSIFSEISHTSDLIAAWTSDLIAPWVQNQHMCQRSNRRNLSISAILSLLFVMSGN